MVYHSKKDAFFSIVIWLTIFILVSANLISFEIAGFVVSLIILLFLFWFFYGTRYVIKDEYLYIYCGPMRGKILIDKIVSVKKTRNFLSSAALSIDRIEIKSDTGLWNKTWYVSPMDEDGFIQALKLKNQHIDTKGMYR